MNKREDELKAKKSSLWDKKEKKKKLSLILYLISLLSMIAIISVYNANGYIRLY